MEESAELWALLQRSPVSMATRLGALVPKQTSHMSKNLPSLFCGKWKFGLVSKESAECLVFENEQKKKLKSN